MTPWYENYLKSDHWQRTRIHRLLRCNIDDLMGGIQCEKDDCKLFVPFMAINVHHLTYKRVGKERMEDLQVLCRSCHRREHGLTPELWWETAKARGAVSIFEPQIRAYRGIKHIGEVMRECLAYCDVRQVSMPFEKLTVKG